MSPSDLPKLWTEPKKIGHISRILEIKVSDKSKFPKNIYNKSWSPGPIFFTFFFEFLTLKNDFENQNFEMFEEFVNNFGKTDGDIIYSA